MGEPDKNVKFKKVVDNLKRRRLSVQLEQRNELVFPRNNPQKSFHGITNSCLTTALSVDLFYMFYDTENYTIILH